MAIRERKDGPDLAQDHRPVTARQVGVAEADLPKLAVPEWGKVEKEVRPPVTCFIRDQRGGLHKAEVVRMECDSGIGPPASFVCRSCREAFDDATQEGVQAVAIKCPKCKKTGADIIPANAQGAIYETKGGPGVMVYHVQQIETQAEMLVDDPEHPGKKLEQMVTVTVPRNERGTATLTADRIQLA